MFPLTIKTIVWCALFCLINASLLAYAADFNAVDTNTQELLRQLERQRFLREQQETIPDVRGMGEKLQQIEPITPLSMPTDNLPCFTINTVTLVGDNADLFVTTLQKIIRDHTVLGRCLGVVGINAVMATLQNAIIAKGYTTTRVLAAPQDLTTGILVFNIIPGRISQIQLAPNSSRWLALWNATAMRNGDLLNLRDIEQSLENLKRPPTAEADIQIAPALAENGSPLVGYSDILIRYQQRFPFRLSVNIDDAGFKSTGRYQGGITLSGDNLLGLNDLVYINRTHDLGGGDAGKRGNQGFNAHYSVPFGYWMLSANTSNNFFFQEVAGISQSYMFSGKAQSMGSDSID
jgi:hemolysin activation/secretion protein